MQQIKYLNCSNHYSKEKPHRTGGSVHPLNLFEKGKKTTYFRYYIYKNQRKKIFLNYLNKYPFYYESLRTLPLKESSAKEDKRSIQVLKEPCTRSGLKYRVLTIGNARIAQKS